jgi:hypothetical protein
VEDRLEKKLASWIGKILSYGDRLILINSVLTSLPMFLLSFFEIPIGVRKRLDFFRSRFFWQSDQNKKKYRLSKWNMVCRLKDQGGLGIEVLEVKNNCLLSKWLFKIINEEGMWQELLCNKYLKSKTIAEVQAKPSDSPFWKGLMHHKDTFLKYGSFVVGDGKGTRFWEDTWIGAEPLASQYPNLYAIVNHKNVIVASAVKEDGLNISFRRNLAGDRWTSWLELVERIMDVNLNDERDTFKWNLTESGQFSVKSLYVELLNGNTKFLRKYLWKLKTILPKGTGLGARNVPFVTRMKPLIIFLSNAN